MFDLQEELKKLPAKPGVYLMHDKKDAIIYVGKAVSLKNRVRQYFQASRKVSPKIEKMISQIDHFEYIITDSEVEALVLENNLIKEHRPKYNTMLKDDKTYPYIKINVRADYPEVYITRRIINDGSKYFGPYANAGAAKEMVDFIKDKFKIRQCKNFKYKDRPCLNYHIKKCFAPCMGYISKEEYRKNIDEVIALLEGKTDKIKRSLMEEIKQASDSMQYEKAAYLRDKKLAIEAITEKQKVSNISENDIDVIGIARNDFKICVEIFFIRKSKMQGREHYFIDNLEDETDREILSSFIKQYYIDKTPLPNKIMVKETIDDKEIIEQWLTKTAGRKIEIKSPQKGEKLKLVEMAEKNALITLENKEKDKYNILLELKEILNLKKIPQKIESYDISNINGSFIVAGMCVMQNGIVKKNLSRRFKIKTVLQQDDPKCMQEVIERRLKHSLENPNGGFGTLPDLIFVDGGINQIKAAKRASLKYELSIPIYGMVKNDKHQTRALIDENKREIKLSDELMKAITNFQDCVHNTAIEYHRKVRSKEVTKSLLDNIDGIGEVRKTELLKRFGSVEKILNASDDEISQINGINKKMAQKIKEELGKM